MADELTTFINIIEVDPDRQQELVELLTTGAEEVIRHRPGFVDVTILASLDGARVVNVARWRSPQDVEATQADPAAAEYAKRVAAMAPAAPALYRVAAEVR
ncbi:antibiotic biosynthesis monooxygenase [Conexibacter sp. CPCC 206217]|uniref:antibiotic biosynthesis monooxygenase n=1 Tax=Conexibacter sp. CPCC 206217 TaxID=3064574 RepID=UPI0027282E45|nr:antibiotic biosynthesis monooxygenase [Conexibacter sp. CPCC 206217]MDO8213195.1 antibiotic biosynthesis monooxygenase [Conexibacter sp. CPCC 206217]